MTKLKICFLIDSLAPGGAERSTANLAIWLKQHGHDVHVAMLHERRPGFADEVLNEGIPLTYLGQAWWLRIFGLRKLLTRGRFDLLHSCLFSSDLLARAVTTLDWRNSFNTSFSIVSNSYGPHRSQDKLIKPWKLRIVQLIDSISLKITSIQAHAVTQSSKLNAITYLGIKQDDVTVIYRGRAVSHELITQLQYRKMLNLSQDTAVFIHVGRLEHAKNHLGLISAFEKVWLQHPDARLLLVGRDGNASIEIQQQLNKSPARDAILCLGHRTDVPGLLRCADFFVLPSHYEGLSGAMIEAMEAGLPVICSDLDGLREGCEPDRSALLCKPSQPETIASAMARLLDDPELARRLGVRGREIFLERFTLEASCQGMLEFFESVVARGCRAGRTAH